jgi:hypothetical protein
MGEHDLTQGLITTEMDPGVPVRKVRAGALQSISNAFYKELSAPILSEHVPEILADVNPKPFIIGDDEWWLMPSIAENKLLKDKWQTLIAKVEPNGHNTVAVLVQLGPENRTRVQKLLVDQEGTIISSDEEQLTEQFANSLIGSIGIRVWISGSECSGQGNCRRELTGSRYGRIFGIETYEREGSSSDPSNEIHIILKSSDGRVVYGQEALDVLDAREACPNTGSNRGPIRVAPGSSPPLTLGHEALYKKLG